MIDKRDKVDKSGNYIKIYHMDGLRDVLVKTGAATGLALMAAGGIEAGPVDYKAMFETLPTAASVTEVAPHIAPSEAVLRALGATGVR